MRALSRREFLRSLGITLAGLILAGCDGPVDTLTNTFARVTHRLQPPRDRLRACWLQFDDLAKFTAHEAEAGRYESAETNVNRLIADHRVALDELVAGGELSEAVAVDIQESYVAAAQHVWASNSGVACYAPSEGPAYTPASSADLVAQMETLEQMAPSIDVEPETLAMAKSSIQRDIAFLSLTSGEKESFQNAIMQASPGYPYPELSELDMKITPETEQAAEFLIELILRG